MTRWERLQQTQPARIRARPGAWVRIITNNKNKFYDIHFGPADLSVREGDSSVHTEVQFP